ncbi:threonine synthase [Natrialba magadii ATCC 43099]|uniref:Threonine synthase n=1 Tax=Natrialba magadii (strain ATCC 43099 / DSM 3394 / CCM 3739 / CIP 104546 / IAM 13178 / JCM 8861 / NBRC 102185 / NCIMB 2190 / MS3) TaxID=547559 RepID=D3T056_NATMM|nr:threonine synthase [Natrialba magadii]ADD04414.1 threonine synthase [Natrialba magadii ATCC 43099]ELY25810.1 threonine synthase [Natrialba magadii ATCC 43099]
MTASSQARLRCYDCGCTYDHGDRTRCSCGEPLWFDLDVDEFEWPTETAQATEQDPATTGIWRYDAVLPVSAPETTTLPPGSTPLVRAGALDSFAGCELHLKPEGQNPTGSFKDRGTAVGVAHALDTDTDWIGTVSHGNMALSTSAYAAAAGLECTVFVPADIPPERLDLLARHDPHIFRVEGEYGRLYEETLALDTDGDAGITFVNSDTPLRVAGQKTIAYELLEQFRLESPNAPSSPGVPSSSTASTASTAPDAIVLPVSSGGQASGVWKALRELTRSGVLAADDVPRLYFVQAAPCDPIATAFREGREEVMPIDADETIAVSIANSDPPSGTRALTAARDTDGAVVAVPDEATREAMDRLATDAGLAVEPSSAVALAGVRELSDRGEIAADELVVTILTGSGYKESVETEPRSRHIDLADLEHELASVVES